MSNYLELLGVSPQVQDAVSFFVFTMFELAILFIGISFFIGVLQELMPQDKVRKWLSGKNGRGYLLGSLLGGLTPFCSCSTIPFTVGLIRAGAGFGPTMTFLFTSPLVNPYIVPLFIAILGLRITLIYSVVAISMAILTGYLLERFGFQRYLKGELAPTSENTLSTILPMADMAAIEKENQPTVQVQPQIAAFAQVDGGGGCCASASPEIVMAPPSRWRRVAKESLKQYVSMFPYIVLGVGIGAVIHGIIPADLVTNLAGADNPAAVPVAAVIGIPLYIRVSTMMAIAMSLIGKGMSYGAVVALTIGGAGASLPEVAMLKGLFRLPLLAAFLSSVLLIAVIAGYLVNLSMG